MRLIWPIVVNLKILGIFTIVVETADGIKLQSFLRVPKLHRMHEMRAIASANPGVCQSASLSNTRQRCAETAERIDLLF